MGDLCRFCNDFPPYIATFAYALINRAGCAAAALCALHLGQPTGWLFLGGPHAVAWASRLRQRASKRGGRTASRQAPAAWPHRPASDALRPPVAVSVAAGALCAKPSGTGEVSPGAPFRAQSSAQ